MFLFFLFLAQCELLLQVGYSAPTQSAIREDLDLSLAEVCFFIKHPFHYHVVCVADLFSIFLQYSMFGSILTIGAMLGAITSGLVTDSLGRKGVRKIKNFQRCH